MEERSDKILARGSTEFKGIVIGYLHLRIPFIHRSVSVPARMLAVGFWHGIDIRGWRTQLICRARVEIGMVGPRNKRKEKCSERE